MKKREPSSAGRITLRIVMEHMTHRFGLLEHTMNQRFDAVDKRFDAMDKRFQVLEAKVDRNHASLTRQIDGIDQIVNAIEIEHLPKRVKRLEVAAGW